MRNQEKHGHSKRGFFSSEYNTWSNMVSRCKYKNNKSYKNYGGRGIKVCKRWANSFLNFYNDIGPRPTREHTLDRINNNQGYKPSNCRWVSRSEQQVNKRKRKYFGIYKLKVRKRYVVSIQRNKIHKWIGTFKNIKDAIRARNKHLKTVGY